MATLTQNAQADKNHAREHTNYAFSLDADHTALRVVVGVAFLAMIPIIYTLINVVWAAESGINFIGIFGGLIGAYGVAWSLERVLRTRWKSGRTLCVIPAQVSIEKKGHAEAIIDPTQQVNVLMWRFIVKRRARVPKGWYMIACALEQDDTYIAIYTFTSTDEFNAMAGNSRFTALISKKDAQKKDGKDLRMAGEQRRLHIAETARWMHGGELSKEDFETYITELQANFPRWMPTN